MSASRRGSSLTPDNSGEALDKERLGGEEASSRVEKGKVEA
jgi:hypothetical protein